MCCPWYAAKQQGFLRCIVPKDNANEGAVVSGIKVYGVGSIKEAVELLNDIESYEPNTVDIGKLFEGSANDEDVDFSEVVGQAALKRAIEIAVSGMHNMIGPRFGKTMLANGSIMRTVI